MYEKEIKELENRIKRNERYLKKANDSVTINTIMSASLISVLTLLGLGIGFLDGHPVLTPMIGASLSTLLSYKFFENISLAKNMITGAKREIANDNKDLENIRAYVKSHSVEKTTNVVNQPKKETPRINRDEELKRMVDILQNWDEPLPEENKKHSSR